MHDLFGLQVDTAARVMSLATGGQLLCTRSVFDDARQILKGRDLPAIGSLSWLSHGAYLLKGVEDPIEICEVGEEEEGVLQPPPASDKARPADISEEELGWRPAPDASIINRKFDDAPLVLDRDIGNEMLVLAQKVKNGASAAQKRPCSRT